MAWRLVAILLLLPLAGCLEDHPINVSQACITDASGALGRSYSALVRHDAPDEARPTGERAVFAITVLEGQGAAYTAEWQADAGSAQLVLDGQSTGSPAPVGKASWDQPIAPGVHTLELEGAPVASLVTATIKLTATGCPATAP